METFDAHVKQVSVVRRSTKKGNKEYVKVVLEAESGEFTINWKGAPSQAPDLKLDDMVECSVDITLKQRQEDLPLKGEKEREEVPV